MRWSLKGVSVAGLLLLLLVTPAGAGPTRLVQESVQAITESTRVKLLASLARGDIAGAVTLYQAHTGQHAPSWLKNLQVAYSAASQVPGKCQDVARMIHLAFSRLGRSPEYIAFSSKQKNAYMVFELVGGKESSVSRNGYHVAVRLEERIYDAYAGPLGMKLSDYLARLHSIEGVSWQVVAQP